MDGKEYITRIRTLLTNYDNNITFDNDVKSKIANELNRILGQCIFDLIKLEQEVKDED